MEEIEIRPNKVPCWTDLQSSHLSIVGSYFSYLFRTCDLPKLPSVKSIFFNGFLASYLLPSEVASFLQDLEELFRVPRLKEEFLESENSIKKYQLVEAFLSFLLQLLYHKTDSIVDPCEDRILNLEKELRFLLTILGDFSWMLCDDDEHEEFQNLLAEFEAVANGAGRLVFSLFFSKALGKIYESIGVVLDHINHLKANLLSSISSISAYYTTPKTSIVDSFLIVDSLIYDLEDLMKRKDNRISDLKDQIKILHQGLMLLNSCIKDMGSPHPQPSEIGELKEPLMRIGDIAHQAEYLIKAFLVRDAPLWYLINRLTDVNHKIDLIIRTELQQITKKYKFGDLKFGKHFNAQLLATRHSEVVDDVTVGFEDNITDLLDQLVGGRKRLQVIAIHGMPGLGKTTIAKKLYNHPLISDRFDKQSWSVVSQNYQRQSLLTNILVQINSELDRDSISKMREESLVEYIYKTLKGRRYLIVVDDVWDLNVWDDLRRCFPDDGDDGNGSRILLTSRNKDVAPPNSIVHGLPFLSNDQCWELLEKKVFGSGPCPPELQGIGKKIAARCCGLPLTVVVIAGILSTVGMEESTWEEVGGNLASYIDGGNNSVMQILKLSYNHLPDHLKPCFLYFGAFEEDKEISVGNLMRLWIAEGFIRKGKKKSAENIAEEYLMELIDKSLVMVAKRRSDGRGVKACIIHDLWRDLCLKRCKEENFMEILKSHYDNMLEKGHRIRAPGDSVNLRVHSRDSVNLRHCQHVRSFYGGNQTPSFYVRDMRLLRVLHYDHYMHFGIFVGMKYLVNLRYLVTTNVPPGIDCLVNLEYFRTESIVSLNAIVKMMKLRYLHAMLAEYDRGCNSFRTNNLEFLSKVLIKEVKDEKMLKCSPHLRKLKCIYDLIPMEKRECPHLDLSFLTQLDSLDLRYDYSNRYVDLELRFPSNIRKLTLSHSRLRWEKMSILGKLSNLEVLKLRFRAFEGERWDTRDGEFQKLKFLKLDRISLTEWNVDSSQHFPMLQRLVLSYCYDLKEIPSEIGEITTLQLIEVKEQCLKSAAVSAKKIQQEQRDMGNEELRVITSGNYM